MRQSLEFLSFWAINDELDTERLCAQLEEMKRMGYDGTIFHPRYYPGKPAYLSEAYFACLSDVILHAKRLGLQFWIYDENGWPSGSADGATLAAFPDSRCVWLEYVNGRVVRREKRSFNVFDARQTDFFLQHVYEGLHQGLAAEAWSWVSGFFSDEVGFLDGHGASADHGGVPWCEELEKRYVACYGESPAEKLPLLFEESEGYRRFRARYWELLSTILNERFYQKLNSWCMAHGKRYTAHLKAEENLFFQTSFSGSVCWQLKDVCVPAVDVLERSPKVLAYPHFASSVSRQFWTGDTLAEVFGGSGWGLSPQAFAENIDWLAGCGVNTFVTHLWQYNRSTASLQDWPPNIPMGLSWREGMPQLLAELKQKWAGRIPEKSRVLVVAPVRAVQAGFDSREVLRLNPHNGTHTPDTESGVISRRFAGFLEQLKRSGVQFDVSEERMVEQYGCVKDGQFCIGQCLYEAVIVDDACRWSAGAELQTGAAENALQKVAECGSAKAAAEMPPVLRQLKRLYRPADFCWQFVNAGVNQLLLEYTEQCVPLQQTVAPEIQAEMGADFSAAWEILAHDRLEQLCIMGESLPLSRRDEAGWHYEIPETLLRRAQAHGELRISVQETAGEKAVPVEPSSGVEKAAGATGKEVCEDAQATQAKRLGSMVFLRGDFLVQSRSPYEPAGEGQLKTKGPFALACGGYDAVGTVCDTALDLVQLGFPFCGSSVTLTCMAEVKQGCIALGNLQADAVHLWVDDMDAGWVFGQAQCRVWKYDCAKMTGAQRPEAAKRQGQSLEIPDGLHRLRAELFPSTYNSYGPHHYYLGDTPAVSPAQFTGEKNFADPDNAPEQTHVPTYHFRCFGIGEN